MKNTVAALPADQSKQYMVGGAGVCVCGGVLVCAPSTQDTIMALHSCSGSTCRKIKTH